MIGKIYYIQEFFAPKDQHKFQAQIEKVFDQFGFIALKHPKQFFARFIFLCKLFFSLKKGTVVFFLHPLYTRTNKFIVRLARMRGGIPICFVTDINSLRDKTIDLSKEIGYWAALHYFIFHNDEMKRLVESKVGKRSSTFISLFDLMVEPVLAKRQNSNEVVFAGNILKCPFVHDLHHIEAIQWRIYGVTKIEVSHNVSHVQLVDDISDRQPLKGSYGLIWEGNSIEDISNYNGQYLKWVSPLKLSNYLLHSLPVITHKDAAVAPFIEKYKIGFCVSSLHEVAERINKISEEEYQALVANTYPFATKIAAGYYTKKAIEDILEIVKEAS
jgi:hypothetical protein